MSSNASAPVQGNAPSAETTPPAADLAAQFAALQAQHQALQAQFAAQARAARVQQFAALTGEPVAEIDDATADTLASLSDVQFALLTKVTAKKPELPASLFAETLSPDLSGGQPDTLAAFVARRFEVTQ